MADNIVSQLYPAPWPVIVTDPAAPVSGDPVRFGDLTGIALVSEGGGGLGAALTMVDFGIFVATHPVNDHVGGGVAVGAPLFYVDAADRLENDSAGFFYGFALEIVGVGATTNIRVLHVPSPGAGTLGAGTIATAHLAAGILSADANGRAKMAAALFDAATVTAKFAVNTITGREIKAGVYQNDLLAGAAAGDHALAAIAVGDELVSVLHNTAGTFVDLTSEFTVAAGKITNAAGTDTAGDQLWITWIDKT